MLNTQETYWGEMPKENIEIPKSPDLLQKQNNLFILPMIPWDPMDLKLQALY